MVRYKSIRRRAGRLAGVLGNKCQIVGRVCRTSTERKGTAVRRNVPVEPYELAACGLGCTRCPQFRSKCEAAG